MCAVAFRPRIDQGFTLIEIIIVMVIISIMITMASLAVGNTIRKNQLHFFAQQFYEELRFAQQQAIIHTQVLGVRVTDDAYQFYRFVLARNDTEVAHWELINHHKFLSGHAVPDFMTLKINTPLSSDDEQPQIIINTDAELTPFTLELGLLDTAPSFNISGDRSGNLQINHQASL